MFISIFGVPSAQTSLGVNAIRILFTAALGEHDIIYPVTLEDLKTAWSQRTRRHIISFNERPHGDLIPFLKQADVPFIVFLKPGATVANELIKDRSLEPMDAIRTASICMSVMEEVARGSKSLVIRSDARNRNRLRNLMRKVMEFVGVDLEPDKFTRLLTQIAPNQPEPDSVYLEDLYTNALNASGRGSPPSGVSAHNIPTKFLEMYDPILEGKAIQRVEWRPEHFMRMDEPEARLDGFIDLMGPARILTYGPYFGLPRGSWSAAVHITTSDNTSGNKLIVEVTSDIFLARGQCKLPASGDFEFEIAFDVVEPRHGIEIRLGIAEGAIEGALRLNQVILTRSAT